MNLTCPTKAILREERSEEVEHARVAPREEEAFLRGKDSNIIGNCLLFPLLLFFFSSFDDLFERKSYGTTHRVFLFWRIFFGLRETKLIILLYAFWERIEQQFVKSFFFEYISCLFIRGERKYKNLRMLETGGRGRLTRK